MKSILNKLNEYVLIYDKSNRVKFCNNKLLKELGCSLEDVLEIDIKEIIKNVDENEESKGISCDLNEEIYSINLKDNKSFKIIGDTTYDKFEEEDAYCILGREYKNNSYKVNDMKILLDDIEKRLREEIYTNYNLLNDIKNLDYNDGNLCDTLRIVGKDIVNCTKASGLIIIIFDRHKKKYVPIIEGTNLKNDSVDCKELDICKKYILNGISYIGLKHKDEILKKYKLIPAFLGDIDYLGSYEIKLGDEYIGRLYISYKDIGISKYSQDDFMNVICNKIAILIKNHRLAEDLQIENEKRELTEKKLEMYLNTAVDMVGEIGIDGYFKTINSSWTNVIGWSKEELLSMQVSEIIHEEDMDMIKDDISLELKEGDVRRAVIRIKRKSGDYVHLDWSSKYIKDKKAFIVTVKDITEQKKFEYERIKLEEAIKLESVKNEFFANISHEFKTPLNIILGTMQLIRKNIAQDNVSTEALSKHMNIIKQNTYRLLRLVNNLIDISRIDTGYYELNLSNQNIVNIIEDITLSVADYVENRDIELIFDTDKEEIITACDPDKIERVILNILSNAIKYTPKRGKIDVKLDSSEEKILVSIKDSGIGIPKEKIDVIFDRFGQVNSDLSRVNEGSGIGLSLVKSILNLHGGDIKVRSEVGKGSEFIIELPIKVLEKEIIQVTQDSGSHIIEKCNIEFADIYS